jgi:hypothetical protein
VDSSDASIASSTEDRVGEIDAIKASRDCCIDQLLPPASYSKTGATFRVDPVGDRRLLLNSVKEPSSPLGVTWWTRRCGRRRAP